ncbi:response regulator [Roseibacterium beibuensis]|uniref:ATP-binding protein n=1 Tax=[Roseibacterium] beibuensis TaxID=1193142 RepID=UPI00217F202F|nr:ATP-binding protein [Roseibacterium beibuensis]MCS6624492.1 response regulator [Roseibacterium beibuensis]
MKQALWGFDAAFDRTAALTRRQAPARAAICVLVFVTGLTAIPLPTMLAWAAAFAAGDITLWLATDPRHQARRPVLFRTLRLLATSVSSTAWATVGAMWWFAPGDHVKAVAVALLGGTLIYVVRGCHRSLVQMIAAGAPPAVVLLYLSFTGSSLTETAGLVGSLMLVLVYAASSGANAWKSHRELEKATLALVEKQREAEAASVAKSEFLANMSHEIRTPLNGVLAMAHVLEKADLPPREKEAASLICASGEMLERLLSDILDIAKVEAGQLEIETAPFHAGELARNAGRLCRAKAEEKGVRLTVAVDPAADRVWLGDAVRVRQVIINLLSNAVKFTDVGDVHLRLELDGEGRLLFTVSDTGVGFEASFRERLFDRFQQADGSITRRFGGSGLGLAICKQLSDVMGGFLDCDSVPGQGTEFRFALALPPAEAATADEAARHVDHSAVPGLDPALRLLIADDHPTNRKVVEIILAGAGMRITTVDNGLEAVRAHGLGVYDLILMDMQMPVMDGLTAIAEIRAAEARLGAPRVPIVMLTANALPEHVRAGRQAGADGHLTKPITPASLLAAINDALGTTDPEAASVAA